MRFPRQSKIFRGQIDAAPLAGVFFLLVIFLLLASLIYTPGIPIQLSGATAREAKLLTISKTGGMTFENKTYDTNSLAELRNALKILPPKTKVVIQAADPKTQRPLLMELRNVARISDLQLEISGADIDLPDSKILASPSGETVVVAVNAAGQFFFENQLIGRDKLRANLVTAARQSRTSVTLVVMADKAVEYGVIVALADLANEAGIKQAVLPVHPRTTKTSR